MAFFLYLSLPLSLARDVPLVLFFAQSSEKTKQFMSCELPRIEPYCQNNNANSNQCKNCSLISDAFITNDKSTECVCVCV